MLFPPFWAKGIHGDFRAWRWSLNSLAEAQALADAAARKLAERFEAGGFLDRKGEYYPDRPFREQILRGFKDQSGQVSAVITRNSYGCEVLNTARVMFVDIDLPAAKKPGLLRSLFGGTVAKKPENHQAEAIQRVEMWTRNNPDWGWRIYRTRLGLRLMATQGFVEPDAPATKQIFESLGTDPLYQRLCLSQKCFRARLTPKPWRCGLRRKPDRWPWPDAEAEARFEKWNKEYQRCSELWATCQFLRSIGNPSVHPEIGPAIELHDSATRAASSLELA